MTHQPDDLDRRAAQEAAQERGQRPTPPRRRLELTLKLGADDWHSLLGTLDHIRFELSVKADDDVPVQIVSGGYDSGYTLTVNIAPAQTHERWEADLKDFLNALNNASEQDGAS